VQTPEPQQRDRSSTATTDPDAAGADGLAETPTPVEVRVHADPALIPSVRAVAADLAARADFDLDAVSDLRMAVDEACSALVPLAREGGQLRCGFAMADGRIDVICRVPVTDQATLRQDTFGWRVLTTLTDDAEVLDTDPEWLGIHLRKQRLTP
jgi:serine/threonine-protein kinase RsbW